MLTLALAVVEIALPDSINPSLIGGERFVATVMRARAQRILRPVAIGYSLTGP